METETEPKRVSELTLDSSFVCPHCAGEIVIDWGHVSIVTLKQYQEEIQRKLKEQKEKDKHGN